MRIDLCGVRGSTPAPGPAFVQIGGHTSCVAITPDGSSAPTLILDAGTGIRRVTDLLGDAPFRGTIALTHLHWDHVQGLPFFAGADRADARTTLLAPASPDDTPLADVLRRSMGPPHFPIGPDELLGQWTFRGIDEHTWTDHGLTITARHVPHKGGRTFGYRVSDGLRSLAYLPDHLPASGGPDRDAALSLTGDVDLLLHDAQFTAEESAQAAAYGHATIDQAQALALEAGVGALLLFHHAPNRRDEELLRLQATLGDAPVRTSVAVEGMHHIV